jgi:ribose transport system ATP-binding protein
VVRGLRAQGVAIFLISTEPETVLSLADRALVMRKGHFTAELAGAALTKENLLKTA